jgi:formyl-CoA transferase
MWSAVCKVLGRPELETNPLFKSNDDRWRNRAALEAIITEWTMQRPKHEVMRLMGDAGVPCGACQDTGEVMTDPHLRAREMIVEVDYPPRGTFMTVGCPLKLSASPVEIERPPMLGEHTGALLAELCGVTPDELTTLKAKGAI